MGSALGGLVLLAGVSLAIYVVWVAMWLRQSWPLAEVLLLACVCWWCQVLFMQLMLGWLGLLNARWLGGVSLAFALGVEGWGWRYARSDALRVHWAALHGGLRALRASPAALALVLLQFIWVGWIVFLGVILPPYAFDEHSYHLPIAASFLQDQRIGFIPSPIPWISAYPKNSELFVLWNCIWSRRDTAADLTMLPFALVGGLAVYAAGRRLGASVAVACIAASVFVFSPTVLIQARSSYNDVMQGALWATAICFLVPSNTNRPRLPLLGTALVTGLLAGLLAGTKYTGLVFAPTLALLLVQAALGRDGWRALLPCLGLFAIGACATGAYWYILNFVIYGNPLWPFTVRVGQQVLLAGSVTPAAFEATDSSIKLLGAWPTWQRWLYTWFDHEAVFAIDTRLGGFGPLWIVLGLPSVILWLLFALAQRRWQAVGVIAAHALVLVLLPFNWMPRYTLSVLVLGGCGVAATLGRLECWTQRGVALLVVCLALFSVINSVDLLFFPVSTIRTFASLTDDERTDTRLNPGGWFGPSYTWVERELPAGSVIGYSNDVLFIYPLWGPNFAHRVVALPENGTQACIAGMQQVGAHVAFVNAKGVQAACLSTDPRARLVFDGNDGLKIFEVP